MAQDPANAPFHGLFEWRRQSGKDVAATFAIAAASQSPRTVPCPDTGRPLRVASLEVSNSSVCPACAQLGTGGYVSFVGDLRLAFACPNCRKLVWIVGT
jgi:hypothetical protein